jgi:hypothetical protein
MLAAVMAEGHAPAISRKPGVGLSGISNGYGTGAGIEGVKLALHACRIHEKVPVRPTYCNQSVGVSNQVTTGNTLVGLGAISTHSVQGREEAKHCAIQKLGNCSYQEE